MIGIRLTMFSSPGSGIVASSVHCHPRGASARGLGGEPHPVGDPGVGFAHRTVWSIVPGHRAVGHHRQSKRIGISVQILLQIGQRSGIDRIRIERLEVNLRRHDRRLAGIRQPVTLPEFVRLAEHLLREGVALLPGNQEPPLRREAGEGNIVRPGEPPSS